LRILITNNSLDARGGSELYVRDLAIGLLKRGHTPIAYSAKLGEVARDIRAATIPVIDNLDALGVPPDIIHGHHHLETMTALLRFPGVPAVSFCHGWLPWQEFAPRFPRILKYVAVDDVCRDRLIFECGISPDRVRVLLNFVDLERFKPRQPLPVRPARALVFSNQANEYTHTPAVREACARQGIEIDVIGINSGNVCARPEEILGRYDIVFAKARAALESLAVGTAVVLCDAAGVGSLVTASEFDRLRSLNFGLRTLVEPLSAEVLERQIARYDAEDAAKVSRLVRAGAGRDATVDQIIPLYLEVIAENQNKAADRNEELRAASAYVRWLAPLLKIDYSIEDRVATTEQRLEHVRQERDRLQSLILERDQELETRSTQSTEVERFEHQLEVSEEAVGKLTLTADSMANQLKEVAGRLAEKESELASAASSLAEKQRELDRITTSLGWRLLSRYGPFKHKVLLPAYRSIGRAFSSESHTASDQRDTSLNPNGQHGYSPSDLKPARNINDPTILMEQVFSDIYRRRAWGEDCESVSGPGSSVACTFSFRDSIPVLLNEIKARTLLDAGCGDFNWMKLIQLDLEYFGVDVVPELIAVNQLLYGNATRTFINLDLSRDSLPKTDIILSRDCLVHFSFQDIFATLKNFRASHTTHLLTTTFSGIEANVDLETGGWRYLDLQMPPFNFPEPVKLIEERRIDSGGVTVVKYLGLWALRDIRLPGDPTTDLREG
jgi:glycosyl transferase family 4